MLTRRSSIIHSNRETTDQLTTFNEAHLSLGLDFGHPWCKGMSGWVDTVACWHFSFSPYALSTLCATTVVLDHSKYLKPVKQSVNRETSEIITKLRCYSWNLSIKNVSSIVWLLFEHVCIPSQAHSEYIPFTKQGVHVGRSKRLQLSSACHCALIMDIKTLW